jgi:hypothetical protein
MWMMDNDFVFDLDDVLKSVSSAEVMSIFFPNFRKAVVIDTRSNSTDGPMVRVMPMAASPQERLRVIRRLRPSFPRVRNLIVIPWPRYVDSLVELGVWDRIVQRVIAAGNNETVVACQQALGELKRTEKEEMAAVVKGLNYQTIWSANQ